MKRIYLRIILLTTLIILLVAINVPFKDENEAKIFTMPELPRPIAKAPVVITSAGQSTDTYIIRDISNQMMLRSYFMPQARDTDIKDIKTIVFVVGYSSLGMRLQNISYEEEKARIGKLLEKAKDKEMTVLTVVMCGEQQNNNRTEELIRMLGEETDYFIGLRDSGSESILTELAKDGDVSLTLVKSVNEISEPFASAFR